MSIRILIAADHPVVRSGLYALLDSQSDFEVVAVLTLASQGNANKAIATKLHITEATVKSHIGRLSS